MSAVLAKATDCCGAGVTVTPSCTDAGAAVLKSLKQLYFGMGEPASFTPDDTTITNIYIDQDPTSLTYKQQFIWMVSTQSWG